MQTLRPTFMSISSLVLELWHFSFIRDWPEIRKLEIPPSKFCRISGDCGELCIPNLARMSLIECYWMSQNSRVTAFTVFELLRKTNCGGVKLPLSPLPPTQIRVKGNFYTVFSESFPWSNTKILKFPWTQVVTSTCIRCSEDVMI